MRKGIAVIILSLFLGLFLSCCRRGASVHPSVANDESIDEPIYKGKWGYIDTTGKLVIPAQFYQTQPFTEGLAAVDPDEGGYKKSQRNEVWGYINKSGKFVIEPQYEFAAAFSQGRALVKKDGKFGFIDKKGQWIIEPVYDQAGSFSEGLAQVVKDGKAGYIDLTGKVVIPLQFTYAARFSEGRAVVSTDDRWTVPDEFNRGDSPAFRPSSSDKTQDLSLLEGDEFDSGSESRYVSKQFRYIKKSGEFITSKKFEEASNFSNERALQTEIIEVKEEGVEQEEEYFIDKNTNRVFTVDEYGDADNFSGGLTSIKFTTGERAVYENIYRDRFGRQVYKDAPISSTFFLGFHEGLSGASVCTKYDPQRLNKCLDGGWGYMGKSGTLIIPPHFSELRPFREGLARVRPLNPLLDNSLFGFIDKKGKFVIEPSFIDAGNFSDGMAQVMMPEQ